MSCEGSTRIIKGSHETGVLNIEVKKFTLFNSNRILYDLFGYVCVIRRVLFFLMTILQNLGALISTIFFHV